MHGYVRVLGQWQRSLISDGSETDALDISGITKISDINILAAQTQKY